MREDEEGGGVGVETLETVVARLKVRRGLPLARAALVSEAVDEEEEATADADVSGRPAFGGASGMTSMAMRAHQKDEVGCVLNG